MCGGHNCAGMVGAGGALWTYMNMYRLAYIHAHTCIHTYTHMHTHTHTYIHTYIHTIHTYIHGFMVDVFKFYATAFALIYGKFWKAKFYYLIHSNSSNK